MKSFLLGVSSFCFILAGCTSSGGDSPPPSLKLVWSGEFNYTGLPNPAVWSFETDGNSWGWGNGEDQYYTEARKENAWVQGGVCTITALKERYADGFDYTSARIISRGKADWLYGRIEVRAKLPEGQGIWPAIWMMPTRRPGSSLTREHRRAAYSSMTYTLLR